jgi:hypothetical protein
MEQMRLSKANAAVQEQRIVGFRRLVRDGLAGACARRLPEPTRNSEGIVDWEW